MNLQLYIGQIPTSAAERRALRSLALDLRARFGAARGLDPTVVVLQAAPADMAPIDLLLLGPHAALAGVVRAYRGPLLAQPGGRWAYADSGAAIAEPGGLSPTQLAGAQRDQLREWLCEAAPTLPGLPSGAEIFGHMVAALICAPVLHPDSRISLDIAEHRRQIKVLGLDELPGLAAMLRSDIHLPEPALHTIAAELFGARLWHDGARFLFDLAPARFQLRVLAAGARAERVLPLREGENVLGRRRSAQQHEHRITLSGDELISADHAVLVCGDEPQVLVRDTSKNGTWLVTSGAADERIRGERLLDVGATLRMGATQVRVEEAEPAL